ncbi:MAG: hypothetical protein ABSB10_05095 [Candidatus Bathyarchaeia archaeon]|jgi:hypothetical protein
MSSKLTYTVFLVFLVAGFVGFYLKVATGCNLIADMASLALILTLATLILYTYYTYKIASEAWIPVASFSMQQSKPIPYFVSFEIRNHSKFSLECWCNINPSVCGQDVQMEGFYGARSSWTLPPYGAGAGHFEIPKILAKVGKTVQEMKQMAGTVDVKDQLYFKVAFSFYPVGKKKSKVSLPIQPYYFDFVNTTLVLDF